MVGVAKEWRTGRRDIVHRSVLMICQVRPDRREAAGLNTSLLIKVQGGSMGSLSLDGDICVHS
jgi:hypothetical protein